MPIYDLHRHLEGAHPLSAIGEIAAEHEKLGDMGDPATDARARKAFVLDPQETAAMESDRDRQTAFSKKIEAARRVYVDPDAIRRMTRRTCEASAVEAPDGFELRFSLLSMIECLQKSRERLFDLESWPIADASLCGEEVLRAIVLGAKQSGANVRLRFGLSRKTTSWAHYRAVAEIALEPEFRRDLCGLDVLGFAPKRFPETYAAELRTLVERLRAELPDLVIHAGECLNGYPESYPRDSLRSALAWEPNAIGHGVWAASDPRLIDALAKADIPLEICPSSNQLLNASGMRVLTGLIGGEHPLSVLSRCGVPCSIGSDDPSVLGTTLGEDRAFASSLGLDLEAFDAVADRRWKKLPKPSWLV